MLDLLQHVRDGIAVEPRELVDVLALVAALGWILAAPARLDRGAEELDLPAGVVEVVLALDLMTGKGEQARNGVAVGAVPRRADRERPCRIRRDELDLNPLGLSRLPAAVVWPDLCERLAEPAGRQPEIDKARSGDVGTLDLVERPGLLHELGRKVPRRAPVLWRALQRDVRRVVAVGRILRPLELDRRAGQLG